MPKMSQRFELALSRMVESRAEEIDRLNHAKMHDPVLELCWVDDMDESCLPVLDLIRRNVDRNLRRKISKTLGFNLY